MAVTTGIATGVGAILGAVNESKKKKQREISKEKANEMYIDQLMTSAEADAEKAKQMKKVNDYEAGLQQFVKDTPEIGTYEKNERETYLQDHYNVFKNDPGFQYVSDPKNFPEVLLANERGHVSRRILPIYEAGRRLEEGAGYDGIITRL